MNQYADASTPTRVQRHTPPVVRGITDPTLLLATLGTWSTTTFPTLAAAMDATLVLVMYLLDVRSAFVAQLDHEVMRVLKVRDADGCGIPADSVVPLDETFCQYVRATNQPVVVPDAAQDIRVRDVATRTTFTIGAYLGVPLLLRDGRCLGSLCALDPQPRPFTTEQVAAMQLIARHLGTLLERDTMHDVLITADQATQESLHATLRDLDAQTAQLRLVMHEIRTPLTTIQAYTDLIHLEAYGPVPDELYPPLVQIRQAARFLTRMIMDLQQETHGQGQTLQVLCEAFNVCAVADEMVAAYGPQAKAKGLHLWKSVAVTEHILIGDSDRLRQILRNLLDNALRYTATGEVVLQVEEQGNDMVFRVQDTGSGIAPEMQKQIWEQFGRGTSVVPGSGLGLYVVRQLATAMNGTVDVESVVGCGSTFSLRLPKQGPPSHTRSWS